MSNAEDNVQRCALHSDPGGGATFAPCLRLRPCEICTLKYDDIEGNEIVIKRYYSDKADAVIENRTKAGHGFRRILLTTLVRELIQAARQRQEEEGLEDPEYIFMMSDHFQSFYGRLRKTFPCICRSIGIPRNTPYSGRRTFVSSLMDHNVNIKTIQNYVGHKDAKTTLNNYCFDRSEKEERAVQLESARLPFSIDEIITPSPAETLGAADAVPTVPSL